MPLQATSGAASYDGFGGGVPFTPTYIEDVFSTWLYTGNSSTLTINNGIDLSTKGGLVWGKDRVNAGTSHILIDTNRWSAGNNALLYSDLTNSQQGYTQAITAFSTTGFTLGNGVGVGGNNASGTNYVSWTFRKQPKFFDVVTWTGNGTGSRAISHSLASTPGCIILKRTDSADDWWVVHRSASNFGNYAVLNTTAAFTSSINSGISSVGSTSFTVSSYYNSSSATWVAYIFAHDAGGFGLTGTDNVISCGSYTGNGSSTGPTVTLGYEPQWLMIKRATGGSGNWIMYDNMRGMPMPSVEWADLLANSSAAENAASTIDYSALTATGFQIRNALAGVNNSGDTYIYIAIRRGPMRTPTTGTSVYNAIARTGTSATATVTGVGFPPDLAVIKDRIGTTGANWLDRLRGPNLSIRSNNTADEVAAPDVLSSYDQNGVTLGSDTNGVLGTNTSGNAMINWFFRRAPGFFDEVCYTGDGVNGRAVPHNLTVAPELIIAKRRNATAVWLVYQSSLGTGQYLLLNSGGPPSSDVNMWGNTTPTSSNFYVGSSTNFSGGFNYVAYLFASCPGVSKVGNYTGNGTSQTINCGFTGGARWVMIKRTDSSGDWYVWDSTRGIVAGNDPRIAIGVGAAEDTSNDSIDTNSTGFIVNQDASNINVGSATYIYLAIA